MGGKMEMPAMGRQAQGALLLALAGSIWGLNGLFVRVLSDAGLSPLTIVFVRYLCALAMLAPAISAASSRAKRDILALQPQQVACCVGLGLISNALGGVLSAYAIKRVGVSVTTVLLYTAPVFGCLLSRWLYAERLTKEKLAAIACNFGGVVLVVSAGGALAANAAVDGLLAGLAYGLTYALMAVISHPISGTCHPLAIVYYGSLTVVAALALPAFGSGELSLVLQPIPAIAALLYGGVSTVAANLLYQRGMACGVETSKVAVITSVEVAVSAAMGMAVFGEALTAAKMAGICGVLGSIALMNLHAAPSEVHGVHVLLTAEQLRSAYGVEADLGAAVNDVRERRDRAMRH